MTRTTWYNPEVKTATFWQQLPPPLIGLSPMDGVTDHPCRHITKKYGRPHLIYTEFTSVEGICHGAERLLKDFLFDETQRPIIGQIYGTTPDFFRQTTILLCELGFDGIDINMGCPAKNVAHSGAGAALIKTPQLAQEIIRATKLGIQQWQAGIKLADLLNIQPEIQSLVTQRHHQLPPDYQHREREVPVSVKTRIGYDHQSVDEWIPQLLEMEPAAIALHGRTLKQQYGGQADWDAIGRAAQLAHTTDTLLLGNGDVQTLDMVHQKVAEYSVDGVLIGRATMGNPGIFGAESDWPEGTTRFTIALEHARFFEETFQADDYYNFLPMRKHLGWYVRDIANASAIRIELFKTTSASEVEAVLSQHGLL